jgi:hypothetical protein
MNRITLPEELIAFAKDNDIDINEINIDHKSLPRYIRVVGDRSLDAAEIGTAYGCEGKAEEVKVCFFDNNYKTSNIAILKCE